MSQAGAPARLWAKDLPLDAAIHRFTVGEDPQLDLELLPWDLLGSAAHARMLGAVGVLGAAEVTALLAELRQLHGQAVRGELQVPVELEDGHTLIETRLTAVLGDAGARIHAGRSRNDQVALAQNLWTRERTLLLQQALLDMAGVLLAFGARHSQQALPGYTHLQRAMPSSFGQWALAYAEALAEEAEAGQGVLRRLDRCPLGAAAGYGVPLPLDRALVARLLGYRRVHVSPIDAIAARQRHALAFCDWCASIGTVLERLAWDLVLYSSAEFGFVRLDPAYTTGSSIMPQKRNPDVAELLRARARQLRAYPLELAQVGTGLPSGYHRDFQLGKAPLLRAGLQAESLLGIAARVLAAVQPQAEACARAMTPDLHATAAAYARVQQGEPFRSAYRAVAAQLADGSFVAPASTAEQVSLGAPPRLGSGLVRRRVAKLQARLEAERLRLLGCYERLWVLSS